MLFKKNQDAVNNRKESGYFRSIWWCCNQHWFYRSTNSCNYRAYGSNRFTSSNKQTRFFYSPWFNAFGRSSQTFIKLPAKAQYSRLPRTDLKNRNQEITITIL